MKLFLLILFLIPSRSEAINLIGKLPGAWSGLNDRKRGVQIHPGKIHIRFCRPMRITGKGQVTEDATDHLGYHMIVHPVSVYGKGPEDNRCLLKGHHDCFFTLMHWEDQPRELYLDLICDNGSFVQQYRRRAWK